jgi:hypothetical protein
VRFPPGRVSVRLGPEHHAAYRRLYSRYGTVLAGVPVLRDRDFDGRKVVLKQEELDALNAALISPDGAGPPDETFGSQERSRSKLFKRLQYLS